MEQEDKNFRQKEINRRIDSRLVLLEKAVKELEQKILERKIPEQEIPEHNWIIDKLVIENLNTDKVDFNIAGIDVEELSGMLSIGLNYSGRPPEEKKNGKKEEKKEEEKEVPSAKPPATAVRKGKTPPRTNCPVFSKPVIKFTYLSGRGKNNY